MYKYYLRCKSVTIVESKYLRLIHNVEGQHVNLIYFGKVFNYFVNSTLKNIIILEVYDNQFLKKYKMAIKDLICCMLTSYELLKLTCLITAMEITLHLFLVISRDDVYVFFSYKLIKRRKSCKIYTKSIRSN